MAVAAQLGISRDLLPLPGETILEAIEEQGLSVDAVAQKAQIKTSNLKKVISGAKPISQNLAKKLAKIFGIKESFWMNLQIDYDHCLQKLDEAEGVDETEKDVLGRLQQSGLPEHLEKGKHLSRTHPSAVG